MPADIEAAITAAIDVENAIVVGWVVVAAYKAPHQDGETTGYWRGSAPWQPYHSTLGLLSYGLDNLREDSDG
jgi:hypothetical protein